MKVHAFSNDALGYDDAIALAERLRKGEVSPKEVAEAAIQRIEKVEPQLQSVAFPLYEQALSQAARLGQGYFAGVPTFIKDNSDVIGTPSKHGSRAIGDRPAQKNDAFVEQYLAQGYTLLGKTSLPEFGLNATTEFAHGDASRNPWNTDYSTGGSSGGSAALVAAGAVPIAHANDGGGSTRIPAACCGLVGLKVSRGRHRDKSSVKLLPVNIVSEGCVTRSVRDTARFYAEAEHYYYNSKLPRLGHVEGPNTRRLCVGLWTDVLTGGALDSDTRKAVEDAARLLEKNGHSIVPLSLPVEPSFIEDFGLYWSFLAFAFDKFGALMFGKDFDGARLESLTLGLSQQFKSQFHKTPRFLYGLRKIRKQYEDTFRSFDAVLSPVLSHSTPPIGHLNPKLEFEELYSRLMDYVGFTPWANVSGGPAISLPMGVSEKGLPTSIHLFGRFGEEKTLLELAYEIEAEQAPPLIYQ